VKVSLEGVGYGDGADILPTSGSVEFQEGVATAQLTLTVLDDQVRLGWHFISVLVWRQ